MRIKVKEIQSLNEKIIMKGFSKSAFSKEIELSQPMTVQITNGERSPSPRTAKRICEVLECEWSDLFEIVKTPQGVNK
ncbi:helix-turn-helix transcriptional regulator [Paenibacillus sp. BIC5C1]|uniref:helix-turn-helix transcriptional regulator n=1 Tax=Paenibacillus sp. BIC5C1 TaxID=3078263 RepID=UPI0028E2E8BD|nr:helix-turn-helix transcriptional regulator [Paenibacillus sp. BIC5C1]